MPSYIAKFQEGGVARVTFKVGDDGRTHAVVFPKASGISEIDRAVLRLIASLEALPTGKLAGYLSPFSRYRTSGEVDKAIAREAMTKRRLWRIRKRQRQTQGAAQSGPIATSCAGSAALSCHVAYLRDPHSRRRTAES